MSKAKLNGVEIDYEVRGKGDPLLLIMGLGASRLMWTPQLEGLADKFKLIAHDNRGAGKSEKPEGPYTIRTMADDAAALLDHLGIENAYVLGASMGGMIAQEFALSHPDKTRKVIFACTYAKPAPAVKAMASNLGPMLKQFNPQDALKTADLSIEGIKKNPMLSMLVETNFAPGFIDKEPEKFTRIMKLTLEDMSPPDSFMAQMEACLNHDTTGRLKDLKVPAMVMHGVEDRLLPKTYGDELAELTPNAKYVTIPDTGHAFNWEAEDTFNNAVLEFFKE